MTDDWKALAAARAKVEALLNPRNVTIMGASDRPGNWAARVWRNLKRYGYPGPVYPFNPGRDIVWDTRCYRNFSELPEAPDHLVVLIPAAAVPDALVEAARAGARSATVMTSGFDEDANAVELTERLKRVIAETGLAVSGPNCLGNVHASAKLMTMPDDRPQLVMPGPVAIIGQSGGIAMSIKRTLEERGVASGSVVTSGNETGLTAADYIAYYAGLPEVKAIVAYLEAVHEREPFLAACRMAREAGKPIVAMKLGASKEGRAAALAHTGRLAGSIAAFDAVAGAAGVVRVDNLDAVVEAVEYFVHAPLPKGRGLGAITFSGGFRGLMLDAAASYGMTFPELAPVTRKKLEALLTVGTVVGNPLDAGFAALTSQDAYLKCVEILLGDPGIDVLLLQEELPRGPGTERKESNLRAVQLIAAHTRKPIAFVTMISHGLTDYSRALREGLPHLAFLQETGKAMSAVKSVMDYTALAAPRRPAATTAPKGARKMLDRILAGAKGREALSETQSKALLKAYGIAAPREAIAGSEREAAALAKKIGFPVVAKAVSASLAHKSDIGGVILGLKSASEVRAAFRRLTGLVAKRAKVKLDGVLIAEQIGDGLELVLGANRDPEMGPVILMGRGGVDLELSPDIALAPAPLDERAAQALIERTRVSKLIGGYRGQKPLDRRALTKALVALSRLVTDAGDRIESIDINPFLLKQRGGIALDALVVLPRAATPACAGTRQAPA